MKIVVSDKKTGRTGQMEIEKGKENSLFGLKIGNLMDGGIAGLAGYKLKITGGSDKDGYPMTNALEGTGRRKTMMADGVGFNGEKKGERKRKNLRGNTISEETMQVNATVEEYGKKPFEEVFPKKEKPKEEEKK